jgi:hypothetical protein
MKRKLRSDIDYTGWTKEQHIEHLKTEEAYQKLLKKIDASDIEEFIDEYATLKVELYKKKEEYTTTYEKHTTQFLNKADVYIDKILQKKLFNLQCKWRANLIKLPLIKIIDDFDYWENNIRNCPFISPITEEEMGICIRFLHEEIDWEDNDYQYHFWQNYDGYKMRAKFDSYSDAERSIFGMSEQCNEDDLPKLYTFFDKYQYTHNLMLLEDIRGPIETSYIEKCDELDLAEHEKKMLEDPKYVEEISDLDENGNHKTMDYYIWMRGLQWEKFVDKCEDLQTRELFKQSEFVNRKDKKSIFFERILVHSFKNDTSVYFNLLQEFDIELPIKSNKNWRIALEETAREFQQIKIAEFLPYAYETYLIGLGDYDSIKELIDERVARYSFNTESKEYKLMMERREYMLEGREALTGKKDLDYL